MFIIVSSCIVCQLLCEALRSGYTGDYGTVPDPPELNPLHCMPVSGVHGLFPCAVPSTEGSNHSPKSFCSYFDPAFSPE